MSQILVPISDVNSGWTCSTGTLRYPLIDEVSYDDADYINTSAVSMYEAKLTSARIPKNRANHMILVRASASTSERSVGIYLYQGSTAIVSKNFTLTTSFSTYTYTLTEAEATFITDYTNLRLRIDSGTGYTKYVSQALLSIPDSYNVGLEMGCNF